MMKQRLWTIQHQDAYRQFEKNGVLRANSDFLFCEDDLKFAYDWMTKKLREKVGEPPLGVHYPIWAWYQWEGCRKRRDLRCAGYAKRGTPLVQMEIEIDDSSFLLSDFDDWLFVMANHYIADSEQDFDAFYATLHDNEQRMIENSWEKVFDIDRYIPNWTCPREKKSIQATLWEVSASQVKKVEFFFAK